MKARFIAALLVASFASLAVPSYAGGYGTASVGCGDPGAPASQRGQAVHTKAAENGNGSVVDKKHSGVGGNGSGKSESGRRSAPDSIDPMYRGG
ncbi:hypothetical protein B0G77_7281 [Paraburkholderia sp. BL10I2N1]|nr:hypothetical protein B0G77_7281 [Paraburkholderia sp. BL10I2N1]